MKCKAISTIIGGVLIHLTLGSLYTAANMITYVISYLHVVKGQSSINSSQAGWLFALSIMGQAVSMMIAGKIEFRYGSRACTAIGCAMFNICVACSYWAVNNFYAFLAVYGFLLGFAIGIAYSAPISMAIKWFPANGGLATGIIVAGFGFGSLIFNQVESRIINPSNLPSVIDPTQATMDKFFPYEVCERVPRVFLILAAIYVIGQVIGLVIMVNPSKEEVETMKARVLPITEGLKDKGTGYTPREYRSKVEETPRGQHVVLPTTGVIVDHPYKPNEAIRTGKFWEIWGTFLMVGLTTTFMSAYWKTFGQSFISDDSFLVLAGSVSSVCNGLFRPLWGKMMDKFGYRCSMPFLAILTALLIGTFSLTAHMHQAWFFVWICCIYLCIGGYYSMFPAYTSLSFGHLYMVGNYGYIFTNQFISAFLSAFFINAFIKKLGNLGITLLLAVMLLGAALLSLFGPHWDYHVGRRQAPMTPITSLPPILPPPMEPIQEEEEKKDEAVVDVSEPKEPKEPITPDIIPVTEETKSD